MQITPLLMTSEHRPAQVTIDDDENYIGISASLQLALGKGELRLKSNDPLEYPFLDYNYYEEPFDLERMRKRHSHVHRDRGTPGVPGDPAGADHPGGRGGAIRRGAG